MFTDERNVRRLDDCRATRRNLSVSQGAGENDGRLATNVSELIDEEKATPHRRRETVETLLVLMAQEGLVEATWMRVEDLPPALRRRVIDEIL